MLLRCFDADALCHVNVHFIFSYKLFENKKYCFDEEYVFGTHYDTKLITFKNRKFKSIRCNSDEEIYIFEHLNRLQFIHFKYLPLEV